MIITKRIPIEVYNWESYVHTIGYSYLNIYNRLNGFAVFMYGHKSTAFFLILAVCGNISTSTLLL